MSHKIFNFLCIFIVSLHYCNSRTGRIWNGRDLTKGRFPSYVILRQNNVTADYKGCSGVLIHPRHVVTIGTCVAHRTDYKIFFDGYVVAGAHEAHQCISPCGLRRVEDIYLHPGFKNPKPDFDDIAILALLFEFERNEFISPIDFVTVAPRAGSRVIIVGIGATTEERHPENVKYATAYIQKMSFCGTSREDDDPRVLCIGWASTYQVIRASAGDGGAPAYYVDKVAAIDSYHEVNEPGSISVSLAHYRSFLEEKMGNSMGRKLLRAKISSKSSKIYSKLWIVIFFCSTIILT